MGYIKEPQNIDLLVAPSVLSENAKRLIDAAISQYRKTGKTPTDAPPMIGKANNITKRNKLQSH